MPRVVLFSPWKWECAQSRSWVCFLKEKRGSHKSGCTAGLELQSPAGTMDLHLDPNLGFFFLPVPRPSFTHQAVGISSGHPSGSPLPSPRIPNHHRCCIKTHRGI